MLDAPRTLPSDPDELRQTAEGLVELVKSQALRIDKLEHQLAGLRRHRFGSKSETLDQLELRLEEEEIAASKTVPPVHNDTASPKPRPKRKPLPADLPRNEEVLSPGAACALRRQTEDAGRGRHRGAGIRARTLRGEPHRPPPHGLRRAARRSIRRRCRRGRSSAADPVPACSRMCWSPSTRITVCHEHTHSDGGVELCER